MDYRLDPLYDSWWGHDHYSNFNTIKEYFFGKSPLKFLEIGTFEGRTAVWLLDSILRNPLDRMYCLDNNITDNALYNLSFHKDKTIILNGYSEDLLPQLLKDHKNSFDFIYVDGDHIASNVIFDMVLSWKLLRKDGIMLMDDYFLDERDKCFDHLRKSIRTILPPMHAIKSFITLYPNDFTIFIKNCQIGLKKLV